MMILKHASGLSEKFYKTAKIRLIVNLLKPLCDKDHNNQVPAKNTHTHNPKNLLNY